MDAIHYNNLRQFTYSNDKICTRPIRGIVVSFFGLGFRDMYRDELEIGRYFAKMGMIYLIPYNNPWAWMNKQAVAYTDAIIRCLMEHEALDCTTPIVSSGRSMGGQSALVYTVYASHTPVACVANCPVCDLPFHYTERDDVPRTLCSAFGGEPGPFGEVLKTASPLHLVEKMPDIDYYIFHCEQDMDVSQKRHSDAFVAKMKPAHRIVYHSVPKRGHCDLTEEMQRLYNAYIIKAIDDHCAK